MAERAAVGLAIVAFIAGGWLGHLLGRWRRRRFGQEEYDAGYDDGWDDSLNQGLPEPDATITLASLPPITELSPEALDPDGMPGGWAALHEELAELDVPRPGPAAAGTTGSTGPGHLSPYGGNLTAAQRRRDKHKQRGQYAPVEGEMPGLHDWHDHDPLKWGDEGIAGCPACERQWECPPGIDWTGELAAIRVNGQTDWFTAMMAQVA